MLYPLMTSTRTLVDLGGVWEFKLDHGAGFDDAWYTRPLQDTMPMPVPASFNDLADGADIRDHVGWVWYERELVIPRRFFDQRIWLRFGSVTHTAKVYINGTLAAEHTGGFTPFEVEITTLAQAGKNRLTVAASTIVDYTTLPVGTYREAIVPGQRTVVSDTPNFDFFNYAGIQRPVKMYTTPSAYIHDITITTSLAGATAQVDYAVDIAGATQESMESTESPEVRISILDAQGEPVASARGSTGSLTIEHARLWQPLRAYLYTCVVELWRQGQLLDTYEQPFGVRTVAVSDGKFLINGRPFYFKGFGKHEDSYIHGRGFDEALNVKDLNLLQWIGANAFRTSHYPYSEELMRLADRAGFVVIDEVPAVGLNLNFGALMSGDTQRHATWKELRTHERHAQVIRELIARDKNHPSVVMWSIANEPALDEEGAHEYFAPLAQMTRELDPQKRPITITTVMTVTPDSCRVTDLVDVVALNRYYGWYTQGGQLDLAQAQLRAELTRWVEVAPNKPIIFTEYGADTIAGLHDTTPVMFTEEYQVAFLKANHDVVDAFPTFVGELVWNFADFQTSQNALRVQGNKKGVFTRAREPKMAAHALRERWTRIPDFGYKG